MVVFTKISNTLLIEWSFCLQEGPFKTVAGIVVVKVR
jgi:hypothetical protein